MCKYICNTCFGIATIRLQTLVRKTMLQTILQWLCCLYFHGHRRLAALFGKKNYCWSPGSKTPRCSPYLLKSHCKKARPRRNGSRLPRLSISYRAQTTFLGEYQTEASVLHDRSASARCYQEPITRSLQFQ